MVCLRSALRPRSPSGQNASANAAPKSSPRKKPPCPRAASQLAAIPPAQRRKIFADRKKIDARPFPRVRRLMKSARQKRVFPEKHSSCHHIFYEHVISHGISMPGTLLLTHTVTLHPPCGEKVSASVVLLCPTRSSTESFQNVKKKKYHGITINLFFHNLIFPCVTIFFHDIVGCLYPPFVPRGYGAPNRCGSA